MIRVKQLYVNLDLIESRWGSEPDNLMLLCLAKLYCLEACGWLETWVDEFILAGGDSLIGCNDHKKLLAADVKRTAGFEYSQHIRPLIVKIAGLKAACKIESEIDQIVFAKMCAALSNLKGWRDKLAHTNSDQVQAMTVAPSVCKVEVKNAVIGLYLLKRTFRKHA